MGLSQRSRTHCATLHFMCDIPTIRGPWSFCHHDTTWIKQHDSDPNAASLVLAFTGQQIPHGVTELSDKSALVCQRTVVDVDCPQRAYLSHWSVLWYTTASSDDNNGVQIHSRIMFLSKWASSKLTPPRCCWHVCVGRYLVCQRIGGFLLMLEFYYDAVNPRVSCHLCSPSQTQCSLVCSSNYFHRSTSNEIRSKYIDEGRLRRCFSEELSNTERSDAAPAWHKDLHCMSLSVTLIFLTIIIAAKAHIYGLIK